MSDPLDIMNEFTMRPLSEDPYPYSDYWTKRLAALCERCASAEAKRDEYKQLAKNLGVELAAAEAQNRELLEACKAALEHGTMEDYLNNAGPFEDMVRAIERAEKDDGE